ncbi:transcription factor IIIB 50 kDa subunit [Megalops cyprinoides]|uniref:transcription factor IIIB 50 kDa subunit n=1 Tax=Megalops cyprinoides TaxID=118141 RepID=UPI0018645390|nr:transcription factor IIIB 50 kDa subunit [Megalops cyprinoides]
MASCPECGSSNLVDDSLYSQSQLVCADCGAVVSEGQLTTTRSEENQGTDVQYHQSTAVDKQPCPNLIKGLKRVRALCRILRFPRVIEETAESLFSRAYEHPDFLRCSLKKKESLGGSCVLLGSRQHDWPVAMRTISSLLDTDECTMGMVYQELLKALGVEAPVTSVTHLLDSHCSQYQLSPPGVSEVFSESTPRLSQRAAALVELAADTWLVTGRHPVPVLVAAVYLAWLSLKPCKARLNVPLGRFCKMAKVGAPGVALKRVAEMKEVLCKLGRQLPWVKDEDVEPRNVPTLTEDILKHRITLLRKAMRSFESELPPPNDDPAPSPAPKGPLPLAPPPLQETGGTVSGKSSPPAEKTLESDWPRGEEGGSGAGSAERGAVPSGERNERMETNPEQEVETPDPAPEHWGKRHPFAPPCVQNPRKRPRTVAGPEVRGDEEISDSEIEGYLRTPQEMKEFAEMQKKLTC